MTVFQIDYDLQDPGQDYDKISSVIEGLGDSFHALDSTWFVECDLSRKEVRNKVEDATDKNDQIIVSSSKGVASRNISGLHDWLEQHWD